MRAVGATKRIARFSSKFGINGCQIALRHQDVAVENQHIVAHSTCHTIVACLSRPAVGLVEIAYVEP